MTFTEFAWLLVAALTIFILALLLTPLLWWATAVSRTCNALASDWRPWCWEP